MTQATLAELLYSVHDSAERTVFVLSLLRHGWEHQILQRRSAVTTLLDALVGTNPTAAFWPGDRRIAAAIAAHDSPFFNSSGMAERLLRQARDMSAVAGQLIKLLGARWSVSEFDATNNDWIEILNGGGFTPFNPAYSTKKIGARLSEYADDPDYVRWVVEHRKSIVASERVDYSNVDAIVTFPRVGEAHLRYSRMVMPVMRPNGRRLVLFAARTDSSIDLRN